MQICENLRTSEKIKNKTANVYELLRANINEHAERQKYGNAEMQICESLRTSAKIKNKTSNISSRNMQKDRNAPPFLFPPPPPP